MLIDIRRGVYDPPEVLSRYQGASVYVDGVKIELAWFIDTTNGIVKSYDVLNDGRNWQSFHFYGDEAIQARIKSGEMEILPGDLLSKTVRGAVTLQTREEMQCDTK